MGRGGMLSISVPLLKNHMDEGGKALSVLECAEFLGVNSSAANGALSYMEAIGIVQRLKRRVNFYFLKDTYDEESIETMILEASERIKSTRPACGRSMYDPIIDRFLESEHELVMVDIVGKKPSYVAVVLHQRIKARDLGDRIESYTADKRVYRARD